MQIVLFQPQIPQNTGNIVRTCSATGAKLILIRPLGFSTSSRHLKRAGLDYWDEAHVEEKEDLFTFLASQNREPFFFSSKVTKKYTEAPFSNDSILIFGSETSGLPKACFEKWPDNFYTIPMREEIRCLNLANSVSIVLYEALRQTHFELLKISERSSDKTALIKRDVVNGK